MKFTLDWLYDHLDTKASLDQILNALTHLGIEVEDVENQGAALNGFVVGHVLVCGRHPNADKLSLCTVDDGTQHLQIVCGAPNVRQGMKVALAREGVLIPQTGQPLKKGTIRGVDSQGMLCSARELSLGDAHEGIMDLDQSLVAGTALADALGLNECVINVSLTANRGDCFSVRGIARELAAAGMGTLKPLRPYTFKNTKEHSPPVSIQTEGCAYFTGRLIRQVKNGPSPEWMQKRLKSVGQKPISALVDITNYVCLDFGRPLHVFDADQLKGMLQVRSAQEGEAFTALDGHTHTLHPFMVVVSDDACPVSLAGVMGGQTSSCTDATCNVFLESALFDPSSIAKTGQALHITSESRTRFERGVNPLDVDEGLAMATQYILDICGGEAAEAVTSGFIPSPNTTVSLHLDKLAQYSGLTIGPECAQKYLKNLGFQVRCEENTLVVQVPAWRHDIRLDVDLIEEILRLQGYDTIPPTPLPLKPVVPTFDPVRLVKNVCIRQGLTEIYTWSFMDAHSARYFGTGIELEAPLTQEFSTLRPSLVPGHLKVLHSNQNKSQPDAALFEVARSFTPKGDSVYQPLMVAGIRAQKVYDKTWLTPHRYVDAYDVKVDMLGILSAFGVTSYDLDSKGAPSYYHPGRSVAVKQGPKVLGYFGELHPKILQLFQVDGPIAAFEVFLDALPQTIKRKLAPLALSAYQKVSRDFAFIVDKTLEAEQLVRVVKKVDTTLIQDVTIFDVYSGDKLPQEKKSMAFQVVLQAQDHTLTEEELAAFSQKLVDAVTKNCHGTLRDH